MVHFTSCVCSETYPDVLSDRPVLVCVGKAVCVGKQHEAANIHMECCNKHRLWCQLTGVRSLTASLVAHGFSRT